jgi:hypothetical protein
MRICHRSYEINTHENDETNVSAVIGAGTSFFWGVEGSS